MNYIDFPRDKEQPWDPWWAGAKMRKRLNPTQWAKFVKYRRERIPFRVYTFPVNKVVKLSVD